MQGLRLSAQAIEAGDATLDDLGGGKKKLQSSQIEDLIAVFRNYLDDLANDYDLLTDLGALEDSATKKTCAKLAAFLLVLQPNKFDNGGFAATNANRTGFNYSIDEQNYLAFRYAFGLLYNLPAGLKNPFNYNSSASVHAPSQGRVTRIYD